MRMVTCIAAVGMLTAAGCSQMGMGGPNDQNAQAPFDNGLRTGAAQPTSCSPADATCGSGIGNPSIQSPIQKRELGATPESP